MTSPLPDRPDLQFERKQAKHLLRAYVGGDPAAVARMRAHVSGLEGGTPPTLADAQFVIARERGFDNWPKLKAHIDATQPLARHAERFLRAVGDGQLAVARRVIAQYPAVARHSIHTAAALGDAEGVADWLARDATLATAPGPVDAWPPLIFACASPFHPVSPSHAASSVRTVELLLDRGADANTFMLFDSQDGEAKIPVLYWASVRNNVPVVRILVDRGAEVNDGESVYHAAELNHRDCLDLLLAHGADISNRHPHWKNTPLYFLCGHDEDEGGGAAWAQGVRWLLEHGADPNVTSGDNQETPLHLAAASTRKLVVAGWMLAHGANPDQPRADGRTAYVQAVRSGNVAMVDLLRAHGAQTTGTTDVDELLGACMRADTAAAHAIAERRPDIIARLLEEERGMLVQTIHEDRIDSLRLMVALGFDLSWEGEWGGTALHVAAWLGKPAFVRVLIDLGAPVNVRDSRFGSSPLGWAAHGSTNSHKADADYVVVVDALIDAGADYASSVNQENEPPQSMGSRAVVKRLRERGFLPSTTA